MDLRFGASWRIGEASVLERESVSTFEVDPARPGDASARGEHAFRMVRPNHVTESRADLAVQATATHFHLSIDLVVSVNDAVHFSRHWAESLPRQLL